MFETIGWGMNYPNEDDGGWVDAMCWQLLVSLDPSRSFTEFPESTNFKTIWLFEEFHLIQDTSQGQQFSFFLWFQSCWLQTWGERYWGPWGHNQNLRAAKIDRKIQSESSRLPRFWQLQVPESSSCPFFFWRISGRDFYAIFDHPQQNFGISLLPEGSFVENWSKIVSYIVWFPFFPLIFIESKSIRILRKKTNPSIQSQKPLPRLSDPGRFFLFCF